MDHRLLERALHRTCNLHSGDWNMNVVRKCLYYLSHSAITWVPNSAISNSPNLKFAYLNLTQSQLPQSQIFLAFSQTYPFQPCLISDSTNLRHTRFQTLYIPNSPFILVCTAYKCFTTQLVRLMPKTFRVAMYQYNKK